jgi:beta-lactamase regulating signal transducer with metallopeptidase domain/tetratricopeptide (TPR) repeat protein
MMPENLVTAVRFALDLVFKATVLLSMTALALYALRRASASVRQLVAALGLAGVLVLPAASLFAPRWEIPLVPSPVPAAAKVDAAFGSLELPRPKEANSPALPAVAEKRITTGETLPLPSFENTAVEEPTGREFEPGGTAPKAPTSSSPTKWMYGALALWSVGTLLASTRLVVGAARVARIRRHASAEVDEDWANAARELAAKVGLARSVRLFFSSELAVPVTVGIRRPVVLLPEGARRWNEERRRVVLLHELAHVRRGDWVALLIGQAAGALYWFHPLAWSVRARMQKDCERACDDLVLSSGTRASVYAAHLLSIIRALRLSGQRALPAVAMARRSYWDGRMRAILDPEVARRVITGRESRFAVAALVVAVSLLAVLEPWSTRAAEAVAPDRASGVIDLVSAADQLDSPPSSTSSSSSSCDSKKKERSGTQPAVDRDKKTGKQPSLFVSESSVSPETSEHPVEAAATIEAVAADAIGFVKAGSKKRSSGDWYSRGMSLHNDERYDEAIDAFKRSIDEGHRVEAATYNVACGYARKGDADRAIEWLKKSLEEGFELSSYIERDDDLDGIRSDPRFAELRRTARAGKIEASKHRAERLAERFRQLQSSRSAKGHAFYGIGKELLDVGRYDLAAQAFQESAARGHSEGASLYNTACALSLKGDRAAALGFLEKSLEAGFDNVGLFRKDDDLDNVRGEPRYRELLKMAQDLQLHRFDDWGNMKSWTRAGRRNAWRETEQHFAEYVQSHPQSGRAWFNLGYARIEGERPEAAVEAFQRALDLRYRPATTMYNQACAYSLMDRKDEAFAWLFKALDAGFDASGTLRGDDDLDNLRGDPRYRQALARVKSLGGDDED